MWRKGLKSRTLHWTGVFLGIVFLVENIHGQLTTTCCTATLLSMFSGGDCLCPYKPAALHCNTQHRSQLCPLLFKVASSRNPSGDFGHGIGLETQLLRTDPAKRGGLTSWRPYRPQRHRVSGRIRSRRWDLLPEQPWQRGAAPSRPLSSELFGAPFPRRLQLMITQLTFFSYRREGKKTHEKHSPLFLRQQRFGGRCLLWLLFKWL